MEFLPIYYRPMPPQQQTASPFRDLLRHMLHEELNGNPNLPQAPALQQRRRDVPEKWSKTFRLDSYQPDDVKVVVKDGYVRIDLSPLKLINFTISCNIKVIIAPVVLYMPLL